MSVPRARRHRQQSGPYVVSLREYLEAKIGYEVQLREANDRRYTEVKAEREQAERVKEEGTQRALELARDIQDYKDQQANNLREQIASERGIYATHDDVQAAVARLEALMTPLTAFVNAQQGSHTSTREMIGYGIALVAILAAVLSRFLP